MSIYPSWLGTYTGTSEPGICPNLPLIRSGVRAYTTRRVAIANALADRLKLLVGTAPYYTDLGGRVKSRLGFTDDIETYPEVHLDTGYETRQYQGGGFKERYLPITVRCYVYDEDDSNSLGVLLEDVETMLESSGKLQYTDIDGTTQHTYKLTIMSIATQEVNSPYLYGEISCEVMY